MKFTDDDLKRLKGDIGAMESVRYPYLDVKALLARLEAAEWCMEGTIYAKDSDYELWERHEAWRKACGK